jgi:hypothetical protein
LQPAGSGIAVLNKIQSLQYAKHELERRRNLRAKTQGLEERMFFPKYTTFHRSFAAVFRNSDQQHRQQPS